MIVNHVASNQLIRWFQTYLHVQGSFHYFTKGAAEVGFLIEVNRVAEVPSI